MSERGGAVEDVLASWVDRGELELGASRWQSRCNECNKEQQPAEQSGAKHRCLTFDRARSDDTAPRKRSMRFGNM